MTDKKERAVVLREQGFTYAQISNLMDGVVSLDWCKRNLRDAPTNKPTFDSLVATLVDRANSTEGCSNKEATRIIKCLLDYTPTKDGIRHIKSLARKLGAVFTNPLKRVEGVAYEPKEYYVYAVEVDNIFIYIGKGYKSRWEHVVSGTSHVYELNRLHFTNQQVRIVALQDNLGSRQAHWFEQSCILKYQPEFNIRGSGNVFETESYELDERYGIIYDRK